MLTAARLAYMREYYRLWRLKNPGKNNEYCQRWRFKNKEKYRASQRKYDWGQPRSNHSRISWILRCRINDALKGRSRHGTLTMLIGCTVAQFRSHIESLFQPGMSWENHGEVWHIDHKLPCSSFDLTDAKSQMECFHFLNQQPMFVSENLRKSDSGRRRKI